MPAVAPYIPAKDAAYNSWLTNFSTLLTASPATYGQTAAAAAAVATATAAWSAAYALVTSPSTKTAATVSAKNTERVNSAAIVRPIAIQISLNQGVASTDKTAIGVNPRTSTPLPITAPTTYPALTIQAALPLQHIIRYRDQLSSPSVKAKAYGAIQVQLFGLPSATPITDPNQLQYLQGTTKSPFLQTWGSATAGERAYYSARYITRKGLVGPWAPIVSFIIAN